MQVQGAMCTHAYEKDRYCYPQVRRNAEDYIFISNQAQPGCTEIKASTITCIRASSIFSSLHHWFYTSSIQSPWPPQLHLAYHYLEAPGLLAMTNGTK